MSLPVAVLITIVTTPQQGPNVPLTPPQYLAPVFVAASTNDAAGVSIGNSAANSAVGTGGVLEPSSEIGFPGVTNLNQLWFTGTAADKISVFAQGGPSF